MRIYKEDNESVPVPIQYFLDEGEYDQGDVALVSYDALYDFIKSITVENAPKPIIKPLKRWKPNE